MNNYVGAFTTPEVNGTFNNWCGNCAAMTDANNDGIWEITIPIAAGVDTIEYKFSADNWNIQESLTPGLPCTKTTGPNTNRILAISGNETLPAVCWNSCVTCSATPATSNVTFQVDMNNYTGTYTNVNLNGTFNNWCGGCAVMTDANSDGIYELTVNIPNNDTAEYKFTVDGWTGQETLTPGDPCTKTTTDATGTFTNRFVVPTADTTLLAVCWESCAACSGIGLEENNWIQNVSISPNPSSGVVQVNGLLLTESEIEITVTDLQGRVVYRDVKKATSLNETLNLNNVHSGLYMVNITSEFGSNTEKFIITR